MPEYAFPHYPIYIPSKGRADRCLTARFLMEDHVPFHLVVEPPEQDQYLSRFGEDHVLVLPFHDLGMGSIPARNWIKEHATAAGYLRHWQLDDNIRQIRRRIRDGRRFPCHAGIALAITEDFTERYENIAVAGLNYNMFLAPGENTPPFHLNCRVYSCALFLNSLPNKWRGRYNEDADYCLQVLAAGWCTILLNAFMIDKVKTMSTKGGNTKELYQGDGRLKMARSLERLWPGVVETKRRYKRPQHVVKDSWRRFDTPLKKKSGLLIDPAPNEYGMELVQLKPVKSEALRKLLEEQQKVKGDQT